MYTVIFIKVSKMYMWNSMIGVLKKLFFNSPMMLLHLYIINTLIDTIMYI